MCKESSCVSEFFNSIQLSQQEVQHIIVLSDYDLKTVLSFHKL